MHAMAITPMATMEHQLLRQRLSTPNRRRGPPLSGSCDHSQLYLWFGHLELGCQTTLLSNVRPGCEIRLTPPFVPELTRASAKATFVYTTRPITIAGLCDSASLDVYCAAFTDNTLSRFWEALSGICSRTIPHPDSQVNRLCISPDKRFLAAAGHHTVKLYDIRSTNPAAVLTFEGHTGNITGVAFHCEGKWMVTSSEDGKEVYLSFMPCLLAD